MYRTNWLSLRGGATRKNCVANFSAHSFNCILIMWSLWKIVEDNKIISCFAPMEMVAILDFMAITKLHITLEPGFHTKEAFYNIYKWFHFFQHVILYTASLIISLHGTVNNSKLMKKNCLEQIRVAPSLNISVDIGISELLSEVSWLDECLEGSRTPEQMWAKYHRSLMAHLIIIIINLFLYSAVSFYSSKRFT